MRVLEQQEVEMVSGGVNPIGGGAGAVLGGVGTGISYLFSDPSPTVGGFLSEVAIGTLTGALVGSGASLLVMAWHGTKGAAVVGTVAIGTGFTIHAVSGAANRERAGGSE